MEKSVELSPKILWISACLSTKETGDRRRIFFFAVKIIDLWGKKKKTYNILERIKAVIPKKIVDNTLILWITL